MTTSSTTVSNWDNLTDAQRDYFRHLADGDPRRTSQQFFEASVPTELQSEPALLETYLNGGTVEVPVWVEYQGRASGAYETRTFKVSDKDWSHDVSRANGGSDSADNGRFEDASVNRSRGAADSTPGEQAAADAASDTDVENLLDSVQDVGEAAAWGAAADVAGGLLEATLDGFLPVAGGAVAAKKVYDHFDEPADKVGFGALAGGATVAVLCTPPGQLAVGAYVLWNVGKRGVRLWNKHVAA